MKSNNFKEYDDLGVRFIYPNNWTVETQTWDKGTYAISVDSPEGSFWALAIYPKDVNLDDAAKKILAELHAEYDELEEEEITRYVADYVLEGYEINFFYLDMTSTAQALKFEDENRGYVVFWQTCDRMAVREGEEENLSRVDVFQAMTHTLVSNLTGQEVEYWEDEDDDEFRFGKTEKQIRAEEEREYYRRKYEQARRDVQALAWRSGESDDLNGGLEDFVVAKGAAGSNPRKRESLADLLKAREDAPAKSALQADEQFEDFLRDDDEDEPDDDFRGEDCGDDDLDDYQDEDDLDDEFDDEEENDDEEE